MVDPFNLNNTANIKTNISLFIIFRLVYFPDNITQFTGRNIQTYYEAIKIIFFDFCYFQI